jgi:signal transduction histidine kinase
MPGVQAPRGGSNIVLELSTSLAPERRYVQVSVLHRALTALMLALLCALIAIGLGALFIGRPMRLLVEKARRVGAGDFSGPLRFPRRDELHELAEEMNATCEQLAEAERRVAAETEARLTALEELRHADRLATVGRLAAGVAHELGTPLNVVTERAKLIASGQTRGAEVGESAGIIVAQGQRITAVVRQLLDFARRSSAEKNVADLRDVVHATRTLLDPLADRRGVVVREVLPGEPVPALLHAPRMEQALTNLVMNALQATPRGGMVEIALDRVRAQPPIELGGPAAEHLWLRVRDEGAGVPPQDLPHVFEPFFTTKAIGQGTGLGLAVAYGIVREHGGWMDVESSATGSCFSIYLPPAESLMGAVTGAAGG